jgi:hypothetical protein
MIGTLTVAGSALSNRQSWTPEILGIHKSATTAPGGSDNALLAPSAAVEHSVTI